MAAGRPIFRESKNTKDMKITQPNKCFLDLLWSPPTEQEKREEEKNDLQWLRSPPSEQGGGQVSFSLFAALLATFAWVRIQSSIFHFCFSFISFTFDFNFYLAFTFAAQL